MKSFAKWRTLITDGDVNLVSRVDPGNEVVDPGNEVVEMCKTTSRISLI